MNYHQNKTAEEEFIDSILDYAIITIALLIQFSLVRVIDYILISETYLFLKDSVQLFKFILTDLFLVSKPLLITFPIYLLLRFLNKRLAILSLITCYGCLVLIYLLAVMLGSMTKNVAGIETIDYTYIDSIDLVMIPDLILILLVLIVVILVFIPYLFTLKSKKPSFNFYYLFVGLIAGYFIQLNFISYKKYPTKLEVNKLNYLYDDYLLKKKQSELPDYDFYYDKRE